MFHGNKNVYESCFTHCMCKPNSVSRAFITPELLGHGQANLCFHFAGSGENLPNIAESRDASMDSKDFSSLFVSLFQILMKQNSFLF